MKYFAALSLAAGLAAADMHAMPVAPAAAAGGMTHTVVVGGLKPVATGMAPFLGYSPEAITAAVGDKVKFVFMQKNHTVTQSTFADPCKAMTGGQDSGFMPNADGKAGVEWEMPVDTTEPLWFYCKQRMGTHCGKGMVFSINAKLEGDNTMAAFKQLAINKNGTEAAPLSTAGIQNVPPGAAAAPSTVTVEAGGGTALATHVTSAAGAAAVSPPPAGVAPPAAHATLAVGAGQDGQGLACTCQCLCGESSFPPQAAVNHFGGFAGMLS
ncbi:hypothetical protein BDV95DRAFT_391327 [Massariosphaeria phaeospora]|uniref:Cupredoxin n=1 Tax=Massariosphaeria phaeospora TaxID=100035 RepID=A0A7C8I7H5_9PLEO|nr:hypothetical protein BDV95DRAFT_391327 [Massariosphaeria phaeospora]